MSGRHLTHEVALADIDAETAENIVRRRDMEIKIGHRQVIEIDLGAEVALLAALGDGDLGILAAVELVGPQALEEVDRLVDARLYLRQAVIDGGSSGTATPAARPAPKACSLACRTCRAKVNMSG